MAPTARTRRSRLRRRWRLPLVGVVVGLLAAAVAWLAAAGPRLGPDLDDGPDGNGGATGSATRGGWPSAVASSPSPALTRATPAGPAAASRPAAKPGMPTARGLLRTLSVKGRAARTGYARAAFGPAWADTDRNGCDTRNDVLRRDLASVALKPGTRDCVVASGVLAPDPYTGRTIHYVRGGASEVEIDHVVALGDAWQKGASWWAFRKRLAFANDPLDLLAVDGPTNRRKGDADAATWLPGNRAFRCRYVARQVAVKAKYGLSVTAAERDAIARVLTSCPNQDVPRSAAPTAAPFGGA